MLRWDFGFLGNPSGAFNQNLFKQQCDYALGVDILIAQFQQKLGTQRIHTVDVVFTFCGLLTWLCYVVDKLFSLRSVLSVKCQKDKPKRFLLIGYDLVRFVGERKEAVILLDFYGNIIDIRNPFSVYHISDFKIILLMLGNDRILCAKCLTRLN